MTKKDSKKLKNKNKRLDTKTLELGDFLQDQGIEPKNVIEVITESGDTKVIDVGSVPLGPKAHFEQVIDPEILKRGPPFTIIVKNVNYDATLDDVIEYFSEVTLTPQNRQSNDFSGMGSNHRRGDYIFTVGSEDDLTKALQKDGTRMNNREIVVEIHKPGTKFGDRNSYFGNSKQQNMNRYQKMFNNGIDDIQDWNAARNTNVNQRSTTSGATQRHNRFDTQYFHCDQGFDSDWRSAREEFQSSKNDDSNPKTLHPTSRRERQPEQDLPSDWISAKVEFQQEKQTYNNSRPPTTDSSAPEDWISAKKEFKINSSTNRPNRYEQQKDHIQRGRDADGGFKNKHSFQQTKSRRFNNHPDENDLLSSSWNEKKVEFQNSKKNSNPQGQLKDDSGEFSRFKKSPKSGSRYKPNVDNSRGPLQKQRFKAQEDSILQDENGAWLKNPN